MAIHNPVTVCGESNSSNAVVVKSIDNGLKSAQLSDYVGDMEVVETADVDSSATDTLTLAGPASDGIKVVTIQAIPTSHSSGAKTSDVRVIYVGFTGTPFNDVDTAGLRRTVEMGTERTFVFSDDVLPTGITLKGNAGVGTTTNVVVAEVTYA